MAIKWLAQLLAVPALAATAAALPHGQASQLGAGVGDEALVAALRRSNYISIPGPNPLLRARHEDDNGDDHGAGASWPGEGTMMEFGDIFRDFDTYYLYTHAGPFPDGNYQIGVATAPSPTGPWTLRDDVNPVLRSGTEAWNQHSAGVACACIVKRGIASKLGTNPDYHDDEDHSAIPLGGNHTYLMYYCGTDGSEKGGWNMGVATAPHPLGPFTPYSGNPLVPKTWPDVNRSEGLYPSEVLNVDGGYIMYGEAILTPSHGAGGDGPGSPGQTGSVPLGGIGVWRSPRPEGPFTWAGYADMPGYWGNWDDGGSSSGAVTVHGGVFEMWYDGARLRAQGAKDVYAAGDLGRWESIGVAYSTNGVNFSKNINNPIVNPIDQPSVPQINRNTATSLSECKMLYEHPYRYVFSTMRWEHGEHGSISSDSIEDLGVTVLIDTEYSASAGWRLPMSVIAPRSVRSDEKLQANTTLAISAAKDIDITISFFAPAASAAAPIRYNISVAMPTGDVDGVFDSLDSVRPAQFVGIVSGAQSHHAKPSAPPPPCTPAQNVSGPPVAGKKDGCAASWHCGVCRVGSTAFTDCMSCQPGYLFDRRSSDCTGVCTAPAEQFRQQTLPAAGGEDVRGRFAQIVATVELSGEAGGKALTLEDFSVVVTLAG